MNEIDDSCLYYDVKNKGYGGIGVKLVVADTKEQRKKFLKFRKALYKSNAVYIDNNTFMIKEVFAGKMAILEKMEVNALYVEENNDILCETIVIYTKEMPEYIQVCMFEALENCRAAVDLMIDEITEIGREKGCRKIGIGLYGHINYGLGILNSNFNGLNSFSAPGNPKYYNQYFEDMGFDKVLLNTYCIDRMDDRMQKYERVIKKIESNYTVRIFDRKSYDEMAKVYTDLNNLCFANHKYYYHREYAEDKEMLDELMLFVNFDSFIFIYKDDKPIAFMMWYPDYNELAKPGEIFGVKHWLKYKLGKKTFKNGKVMEYGVLDEYRGRGIPLAMIHQAMKQAEKYKCTGVVTSWVLAGNADSESFCEGICDRKHDEYAVFEKDI